MKRSVEKDLKCKKAFGLKGFDYRLLPLFLSSAPNKVLIIFDDSIEDCYDNLALFLDKEGVFITSDLLSGALAPSGFSGWGGLERSRFLSSLSSGFSNHRFVLLPFSLYNQPIFPKYKILNEIKIGQKTSYEDLLSFLSRLGYSEKDYVNAPGEFAVRGFVIDFFSF